MACKVGGRDPADGWQIGEMISWGTEASKPFSVWSLKFEGWLRENEGVQSEFDDMRGVHMRDHTRQLICKINCGCRGERRYTTRYHKDSKLSFECPIPQTPLLEVLRNSTVISWELLDPHTFNFRVELQGSRQERFWRSEEQRSWRDLPGSTKELA